MNERRPHVEQQVVEWAKEEINAAFKRRLVQHGAGICLSPHEVLGILTEEYQELLSAISTDDSHEILCELTDMAVAALFGMVSIFQGME